MTATNKLRRLLDERGVEWWKASPCKTKWHSPVLGGPLAVREWNGKMVLDAGYVNVIPEQAVEATLGNEESYTRDDVESAFVSGYSLGCLPVGSDPRWDQNEQTVDEHMAELGWVRAATLGAGTCKVESMRG